MDTQNPAQLVAGFLADEGQREAVATAAEQTARVRNVLERFRPQIEACGGDVAELQARYQVELMRIGAFTDSRFVVS